METFNEKECLDTFSIMVTPTLCYKLEKVDDEFMDCLSYEILEVDKGKVYRTGTTITVDYEEELREIKRLLKCVEGDYNIKNRYYSLDQHILNLEVSCYKSAFLVNKIGDRVIELIK